MIKGQKVRLSMTPDEIRKVSLALSTAKTIREIAQAVPAKSVRFLGQKFVQPKDIKKCRLCGGAIWLEEPEKRDGYQSRLAWYHVGRYPHISCARGPTKADPERPLGAGPA